ncbi:MAG: Gx transporter family protein [Lachnospiraceae bacterium]|nr:Gx transporter family protein [Lachnospiraceae bacterium]
MKLSTQKLASLGLFTAVAIIFGYIEAMIPISTIPGIKLGLANLSVLYILQRYSLKEAVCVSAIRIFVIGFMFGNMFSILYSLSGALLSLGVMTLMKRCHASLLATSMAGGLTHNVGQLIIAMLIVENRALLWYAPVLLIAGLATGLVIGIVTNEVLKRTVIRP